MSYQEKLAGSATILVFSLSLILVYFVLAGQYENWITPLAVLPAVPLAVLGNVLAMKVTGLPNNIYVQIGLVLLIALSAKMPFWWWRWPGRVTPKVRAISRRLQMRRLPGSGRSSCLR